MAASAVPRPPASCLTCRAGRCRATCLKLLPISLGGRDARILRGAKLLALAINWDGIPIDGIVAGIAAGGALASAAYSLRRSTDNAEARYRADLVYRYELAPAEDNALEARRVDDSHAPATGRKDIEVPRPKSEATVTPPPASVHAEEDPQRRMAALPIEYHAQVLAQSRASFLFSIAAALAGFLILAVAIAMVLNGQVAPGLATMVAAVITEAVPLLFFTQSNRARKVMAAQLDGFRNDAEIARAASERRELIEMVGDPDKRDALISDTVLKLAEPQVPRGKQLDAIDVGL